VPVGRALINDADRNRVSNMRSNDLLIGSDSAPLCFTEGQLWAEHVGNVTMGQGALMPRSSVFPLRYLSNNHAGANLDTVNLALVYQYPSHAGVSSSYENRATF
jgi:hypothetical protein